jgi:hypothetical protein
MLARTPFGASRRDSYVQGSVEQDHRTSELSTLHRKGQPPFRSWGLWGLGLGAVPTTLQRGPVTGAAAAAGARGHTSCEFVLWGAGFRPRAEAQPPDNPFRTSVRSILLLHHTANRSLRETAPWECFTQEMASLRASIHSYR